MNAPLTDLLLIEFTYLNVSSYYAKNHKQQGKLTNSSILRTPIIQTVPLWFNKRNEASLSIWFTTFSIHFPGSVWTKESKSYVDPVKRIFQHENTYIFEFAKFNENIPFARYLQNFPYSIFKSADIFCTSNPTKRIDIARRPNLPIVWTDRRPKEQNKVKREWWMKFF